MVGLSAALPFSWDIGVLLRSGGWIRQDLRILVNDDRRIVNVSTVLYCTVSLTCITSDIFNLFTLGRLQPVP